MGTQLLELPGSRSLAWIEVGCPEGKPVVAFHGTPGSRHQLFVREAEIADLGIRLVSPDRPGYGRSSFHPRRTLRDWADDVGVLAKELGLDSFAVLGFSGGGPHACACARFLTNAVSRVALVSAIGPLAEEGFRVSGPNRVMATLARHLPPLTRLPAGVLAKLGRRTPDAALEAFRLRFRGPDRAVLEQPQVAARIRDDFSNAPPTFGKALAQDYVLFSHDWGFRLEEIKVPVDIWHGDADANVPIEHARGHSERIPDSRLHIFPGEGHLMCVNHMPEILGELVGRT